MAAQWDAVNDIVSEAAPSSLGQPNIRTPPTRSHIVVFSGGTAANSLVDVFEHVRGEARLSYVIPVSDNGGSSSELLRVFGGPGQLTSPC